MKIVNITACSMRRAKKINAQQDAERAARAKHKIDIKSRKPKIIRKIEKPA